MRILVLEPYYGGSHKAFIDGWNQFGVHELTILGLPAHKWKWRMRHSAITFAEEVGVRHAKGEGWDAIFASDMLNLAEFRGLLPAQVAALPAVCYFHENQLTYPVRHERERDLHFAMTNIISALAAESVWFNSDYHRRSFLDAIDNMLSRMPDYAPLNCVERIGDRSSVMPQGIIPHSRPDESSGVEDRRIPCSRPLRILWNARWEHDKNPEDFFAALRLLKGQGVMFELLVLGESFMDVPEVFGRAQQEFAGEILVWGYRDSREEYLACLRQVDVVVSTARHEFFGVAVVEAVSVGAFPVVPHRLAYPEVLGDHDAFFYDGTVSGLAAKLTKHAGDICAPRSLWETAGVNQKKIISPYFWPNLAQRLDEGMTHLAVNM